MLGCWLLDAYLLVEFVPAGRVLAWQGMMEMNNSPCWVLACLLGVLSATWGLARSLDAFLLRKKGYE